MAAEKRNFDNAAATWDENPGRVKINLDIGSAIFKQNILTPDMDVLDFGCGTGLLTVRLQPFVRSVTGVDSSPGMLNVLNDKISKLHLSNVKTMLIDLEKGQKLTGNYQLALSSLTMHHIPEIKPVLAQLYQVITPEGYLCVADLDPDDHQFHEDKTGVFHSGFDRNLMHKLFADAGFENIQDTTAATVTKPSFSQGRREFTIFLMTGRKKVK
jgi:ubiquinone/menaquinone biosynthesis C-methylase UbiE